MPLFENLYPLMKKLRTVSVSCSFLPFFFRFMVVNVTFNNILLISWRSVFLVEETGVPEENQRPVACHRQTLSHNVASSTTRHERGSNSQF